MESLNVRILDRDYRLACEPSERDTLLAAAAHVDARMQAIREQGKVAGVERIAVFAALNIAGALLSRDALDPPAANAADAPGASPASAASSAFHEQTVDASTASGRALAEAEILRRMQVIDALLDTALASQERLF